ncbi:MAG: cytochrome c peroxidase [Crocinitomicaceae bacterium]|nr:cytochrome c peroxidase [Crocinitomicaceae bacterium]
MKIGSYLGGVILDSLFFWQCRSVKTVTVFQQVQHPVDNESSLEKIELGRALFFDERLSIDNSISCASCHLPELAFTDGKVVSEGVGGRLTARNSPTILNSGYLTTVMFDAHLPTLEMQAIVPIQEHVEMDMDMNALIEKLKAVPEYQAAAKSVFGRDFDPWVLTRSIAAFERSLISNNSRFDRYYYFGDQLALTESEQAGWKLFSEKLYCTECHAPPHFTSFEAENNGLYTDYGEDKGRFRIHNDSLDIGMFKVPSLRNIALTSPYMHDGSMGSLDDVILHYSEGGAGHLLQSDIVKPFELNPHEVVQLKNFLGALTDTSYMINFRD